MFGAMAGDISGCSVWVTCGVVLVAFSKQKHTVCYLGSMLTRLAASRIFLFIALSCAPVIDF